jgi:hypothetical protein
MHLGKIGFARRMRVREPLDFGIVANGRFGEAVLQR